MLSSIIAKKNWAHLGVHDGVLVHECLEVSKIIICINKDNFTYIAIFKTYFVKEIFYLFIH